MAGGTQSLPTERQQQRLILKMRKTCFPRVFMFHVPNGAHLAGSPTARFKQMGALKGDGLVNGVPDLVAIWAVQRMATFEVKRTHKSPVSDEQKAIHALLHELGVPTFIVTGPQEVFDHLHALGAPWNGTVWNG